MRRTPLRPVGRKRKARLAQGKSEPALFRSIWLSSNKKCESCGQYIGLPRTRCFAHVLPKGMYSEYRLDTNNIMMVCGTKCHDLVDGIATGSKRQIKERLDEGIKITFERLREIEEY